MLLKSYKKIPKPIGLIYQQTYSPFSQKFFGVDPDYYDDVKSFYQRNKEKLVELGLDFDDLFQAIDLELTKTKTTLDPRKLHALIKDIERIIYLVNTQHYQTLTELHADLESYREKLILAKINCQYQNSLAITLLQFTFIIAAVLVIATSIAIFFFVPLVTAMVVSAVGTFLSGFLLELPVKLKIYDKLTQYARRKSADEPIITLLQNMINTSETKIVDLKSDIKFIKNAHETALYRLNTITVSAPVVSEGDAEIAQSKLYKKACLANHARRTAKDEGESLSRKSKYALNMHYDRELFAKNAEKVYAKIEHLKQECQDAKQKYARSKLEFSSKNNGLLFTPAYTPTPVHRPHECKPWKSPLALGTV